MTTKERVNAIRSDLHSMSENELTNLEKDLSMLLCEIKHKLYTKKHSRTHFCSLHESSK